MVTTSKLKLLLLWVLCLVITPALLIAMLLQIIGGSTSRALNMAAAYDECGNALFGGPETQTISAHTGNGLIEGKRWAKIVAPMIDFFFGAGHCLSYATEIVTTINTNKE